MTIGFQSFSAQSATQAADLMADDDVLPAMARWNAEGRRFVLVTLVAVEGGAPRQAGAQMAVRDDGHYVGYLSGGCLEQAVALEALAVLADDQPRLVRYGKGSPYFDIKLPCGSGLDLHFDPGFSPDILKDMVALRASRRSFVVRTEIKSGMSSIKQPIDRTTAPPFSREQTSFERGYNPALRLMLLGTGPHLIGMAQLAMATGLDIDVVTPDDATRHALSDVGFNSVSDLSAVDRLIERLDEASAAILFFHDHEQEPHFLKHILSTRSFFVGALGNHAVHRARVARLAALGVVQADIDRVHAPVGMIPGAKSKATMAIGTLAAVMAEAKSRGLVA